MTIKYQKFVIIYMEGTIVCLLYIKMTQNHKNVRMHYNHNLYTNNSFFVEISKYLHSNPPTLAKFITTRRLSPNL